MPKTLFSLAFVTGASAGIGAELSRLLARQGIPLVLTGRDQDRLQAIADELKQQVPVTAIAGDLANPADRKCLVAKIHENLPDLVVNNAGFGLYGEVLTYETQEQMGIVDVNVDAVLELTLEAARALRSAKKKGVILNVSSVAGYLVFPGLTVYAASKAFVTQVSQGLDEELVPYGIRVLTACPGAVHTSFRSRAAGASEVSRDSLSMDAAFAAEQLWKQIVKRKKVHIFDFKTRCFIFFARYFFPQSMLSKILFKRIESYHPPRSFKDEKIG